MSLTSLQNFTIIGQENMKHEEWTFGRTDRLNDRFVWDISEKCLKNVLYQCINAVQRASACRKTVLPLMRIRFPETNRRNRFSMIIPSKEEHTIGKAKNIGFIEFAWNEKKTYMEELKVNKNATDCIHISMTSSNWSGYISVRLAKSNLLSERNHSSIVVVVNGYISFGLNFW